MEPEQTPQVYAYAAPPSSFPVSYAFQPQFGFRPPTTSLPLGATPAPDNLPTPSDSSSSVSASESGDEAERRPKDTEYRGVIFRPVDFDRYTSEADSSGTGPYGYCPPTPTDSERDGNSPPHTGGITARLVDKELWESFREIGNEMIVTKPGRRLFPSVLVSLRGLVPGMEYNVYMRIVSADNFRYKFLGSRWVAMGESEVMQNEERQIVKHPSSPNLGSFWMKKPISFKSVKITHHPQSKLGNILLHTMHKYNIEVVVQPTQVKLSAAFVIRLPEATFTAVTSYQNSKLTQLKIDNNPFAKGFRDRENAVPLGLPSYPSSPLWHMPPMQFPPFSLPRCQPTPSIYPPPSTSSLLPPTSQPSTSPAVPPMSYPCSSFLPPITHCFPLPPVSRDSTTPDSETPTPPMYSVSPLPLTTGYPRPIPSYPFPWGPWNTPTANTTQDGYATDCEED